MLERDGEIRQPYETSERVGNLAQSYGISEARVYQILKGKRK